MPLHSFALGQVLEFNPGKFDGTAARGTYTVVRLQTIGRIDPAAVDPHLPGTQQPIDVALGNALQNAHEKIVDALAGFLLANGRHSGSFPRKPSPFP